MALEGLPGTGTGHLGMEGMTHAMPHTFVLDLPGEVAPFRYVELNWNPSGARARGRLPGHAALRLPLLDGVEAVRESIMPEDPAYAAKAENVPAPEYVPEFNAALAPPGATLADVAVPMMGVHWIDVRSHELQGLLGHPENFTPFTSTFIHGSWDGKLVFWEPMITRAHILAKKTATDTTVRDEIIPVPTPKAYQTAGYYPKAYRITWDQEAREYRIALTNLEKHAN
jgi:hypothetical protein